MRVRAWAGAGVAVAALGVTLATGLATVGCGGGSQGPKFAQVKAGQLPAGETWVGVYFNPVYGYLHMIEQEGNIVGRWKRTDASHWGELSGTADGNVLHFTWKEHKYGAVGPSSDAKGSGQFIFSMPESKIPELAGQYAIDDSNDVGEWHCVKQLNQKPDLNSINGSGQDNMGVSPDSWK